MCARSDLTYANALRSRHPPLCESPPPYRAGPASTVMTRERVCIELVSRAEAYGYGEGAPQCEVARRLRWGMELWRVLLAGDETLFVVHHEGESYRLVDSVGATYSGIGNRYETVVELQLLGTARRFTITWRTVVVDWDLGDLSLVENEDCSGIRCERRGQDFICSQPAQLSQHGAAFELTDTAPDETWPFEPGAMVARWDCHGGP